MERMVDANGTRIFVDERGGPDGFPLLFVHGGPGNSCWDFMAAVGDGLAARGMRVIGVDQRGVLRSDDLSGDVDLTVAMLVEDFEAVRVALGIKCWSVIGHSAGGGYALDYALSRPDSLSGLVLDCPCLDADATDRHRLPRAAEMLRDRGKTDAADACMALASRKGRLTGADKSWESMQPLGEHYLDLFTYDKAGRDAYEKLMASAPRDLSWSKGVSHLPLLTDMYCNRMPALAELRIPSRLIHGEADLVAAPKVIDAYRAADIGDVVTIPEAGHFSYIEQPEAYIDAIVAFADDVTTRSAR